MALRPEPAGLVPEIRHLRRHPPISRSAADNDRVVTGKLFHRRNRGFLVELVMAGCGHRIRHQLRDTTDVNRGTGIPCTGGNRLRHDLYVAIRRVIEHQNFGHIHRISLKREFRCRSTEQLPQTVDKAHAASTNSTSASAKAVTRRTASSRMATPSRSPTG